MLSDRTYPESKLYDLLLAPMVTQAIGAIARLGIADRLADGAMTTGQLAEAVSADATNLRRCLRAAAAAGVLQAEPDDAWRLTPMGSALRSDAPGGVRYMAMTHVDRVHWNTTGLLTESVRTGQAQAATALGCEPWEYYERHPDDADHFSKAMANFSSASIDAVLGHYDFPSAGTVVDVGGAYGDLLMAVLRAYPAARGVLFDLPHIVAKADAVLAEVGPRVDCVAGNFLEDDLPAGDVYLLKHVLHDWDDAPAVRILEGIRRAMRPGGKVLVVELALPEGNPAGPVVLMDLMMMVLYNGRERTAAEYAALFDRAGLRHTRTMPTAGLIGLVEAEAV